MSSIHAQQSGQILWAGQRNGPCPVRRQLYHRQRGIRRHHGRIGGRQIHPALHPRCHEHAHHGNVGGGRHRCLRSEIGAARRFSSGISGLCFPELPPDPLSDPAGKRHAAADHHPHAQIGKAEQGPGGALERVGLEGKGDRLPGEASGGEKERCAIARAIVNDPPVLLADEPTGNLDTRTTDAVMDLFTGLNAEGTTIVMVTHSPRCAAHVHRVLDVADGRLLKGVSMAPPSHCM